MGNIWTLIILIVLMVALFFFMNMSNRKRQKQVQDMLSSLKVGDCVRTIGGIYGQIVEVTDKNVTLEVGKDNSRSLIVFMKEAIYMVEPSGSANKTDAEDDKDLDIDQLVEESLGKSEKEEK